MLIDPQIRKALRRLAHSLRSDEPMNRYPSFISGPIPTHLHSANPDAYQREGAPGLTLTGQAYSSYQGVLNLLLAHRRSRYLSDTQTDRDLTALLWSLCCDIALDDRFKSTDSQNTRIRSFMSAVHISDKQYEAIVHIHGLSIRHRSSLDEVQLIRGTPTLLREWGLWSKPWRPLWRGQTIARMTVQGGTIKAATRFALDQASMICDELRIAIPSVIQARIVDWQVAFQPGWHALRGDTKTMYQPGRLRGKLVQWDGAFDAARSFLEPLYELRATARPNIQKRVELAVRWFGMSWNAETPWAMRLVALFAGFEAILIKGEHEPRKGALLAIRYTLLSIAVEGHFSNPAITLFLYYQRSELVHGARTDADERDYQRAFSMASESLRRYVTVANEHTDVHRHSKLLDLMADPQSLGKLKVWVEEYKPWKYEELLAEIDKLLK